MQKSYAFLNALSSNSSPYLSAYGILCTIGSALPAIARISFQMARLRKEGVLINGLISHTKLAWQTRLSFGMTRSFVVRECYDETSRHTKSVKNLNEITCVVRIIFYDE